MVENYTPPSWAFFGRSVTPLWHVFLSLYLSIPITPDAFLLVLLLGDITLFLDGFFPGNVSHL